MPTAPQPSQSVLDFYTQPGPMTFAGEHAKLFAELPKDIAALAGMTQGLILHEHIAPNYGVQVTEERRREVHTRPIAKVLDTIEAHDTRPLSVTRPLENRFIGNCRTFTVLMVSILRAQGVPARARCGFGTYFEAGKFIDHWVCEYWNAQNQRWVLVDAQIDDVQRKLFQPDFDLLDVPRDRFLVAGDAWLQCRSGQLDPEKFGVMHMHGSWFIGGNVIRDLAALNNVEMLPWDDWGIMPAPDEKIPEPNMTLFDQIAKLATAPDNSFDALRKLYEDERVKVPRTVFNAVRMEKETL